MCKTLFAKTITEHCNHAVGENYHGDVHHLESIDQDCNRLKILIRIDCNYEDWENPTQACLAGQLLPLHLFIKYWDQDCDDEDWEWETQASSTQLKPG